MEIERKTLPVERKDLMFLIEVHWDDIEGPKLVNYFPRDMEFDFSLKDISEQLYDGVKAMYGQDYIIEAEGLLINVKKFNVMAYVFFDSFPDDSFRGGEKEFMFSIIASRITYFQSLKIKQIFFELSSEYKEKREWDVEIFWKRFADVLTNQNL